MSLVSGIPRDSALARSLVGPSATWGEQEELLASLAELIDLGNRLFIQANSKPGARQPDPIRIPRPYEASRQPESATPRKASEDDIERVFKGHIKRNQPRPR